MEEILKDELKIFIEAMIEQQKDDVGQVCPTYG